MNKRQIIILWIIAVVLAGSIAFVKFGRDQDTKGSTSRTPGQTLLESFPADQIASIDIQGAASATTLVKKDGKWNVPARDGFPAKTSGPGGINELLRTMGELKVTQGMQAGSSFAPRFGMDESSKDPKEHGLTVTFKDASGKELTKITVGKNIESAAGAANPMMGAGSTGRFIRNHADESGFYAVNELFPSLSDEPQRWLTEDFIRPEKIRSISVTQPGKSDEAWKIIRKDEESDFAIEGAAAGEAIEPTTATAFKSLLSFARFEDIVPSADVEKESVADQKRVATIVTFEGFTYTLTFTPSKPSDKPANPDAPAEETFLVKVAVAAEIPKERKKEEGEKPEDAKTKDEAFTTRAKELTDKLAAEKALEAYTFRVAKSTLENLAKDRATLTKPPEAPAQPQGRDGGTFRIPPGGLPPGSPPLEAVTEPVEAVTPPVEAPPIQMKEVEPAPEKAPEKKEGE